MGTLKILKIQSWYWSWCQVWWLYLYPNILLKPTTKPQPRKLTNKNCIHVKWKQAYAKILLFISLSLPLPADGKMGRGWAGPGQCISLLSLSVGWLLSADKVIGQLDKTGWLKGLHPSSSSLRKCCFTRHGGTSLTVNCRRTGDLVTMDSTVPVRLGENHTRWQD